MSQRRLGQKFQVNQTTIGRALEKIHISCYKRVKTPRYSEKQAKKLQELCRKLANWFYRDSCSVIMDDDKYFIFYGQNMPQNACYFTDNKDSCPDNVRFHVIEKYPKKILVNVTISDRGISKALIRPSGSLTVNSAIYIKVCLEKRLLPFIEEFHIDGNYIFWPDFANAYYFNETQAWLRGKVKYVSKHLNPPNVPQARPIENFCWFRKCTREVRKPQLSSS